MAMLTVHAVHKTLKESLGRLAGSRCALMFSGGFDAMLMALLMRRYRVQLTAVTVRFDEFNPLTVVEAALLAQRMGLPHHILHVTLTEFLSAFGLLPSIIDEPVLDLDLALVHAAFKKYDPKIAGKIFVSGMGSDQWFGDRALERDAIDEKAHHKVAKAQGYKFVFPFLTKEMRMLSRRIPAALKKNKKLLRAMIMDEEIDLLPNPSGRREIQVPAQVRYFLVKVYSNGKESKADDKTLRRVVRRLWLKKNRNRFLVS